MVYFANGYCVEMKKYLNETISLTLYDQIGRYVDACVVDMKDFSSTLDTWRNW